MHESMKCPHCRITFHNEPHNIDLGHDVDANWGIFRSTCPNCKKFVIELLVLQVARNVMPRTPRWDTPVSRQFVYPRSSRRPPVPQEVPNDLAEDYREACLVFPDSPKASAALSRRCLQHTLRQKGRVKEGDLANEIQQVLDSTQLPSYIAESLDAIRNIGNFAAHPIKSKSTGEIVPVDPAEAEWNLDVLEMLFDFYFVQPEAAKKKKEALNKKLKDAGKPEMK